MMCALCHAQQYLKIVRDRYELKREPHRTLPMKSQKYSVGGGEDMLFSQCLACVIIIEVWI